jgi:tRNA pseudouridine32 synthase/23S rRNA pseudouridine746 synthase
VSEFRYDPPQGPLVIVHRDADLLVLDKPSGLLSVPGKPEGHRDCLQSRVKAAFPAALLVHRLDLDTSGLIVFALNPGAQRHLGLQFERRRTGKTYIARVWGEVAGDSGRIDLPVGIDWPNRPLHHVTGAGKPAITDWRVLARTGTTTRLALTPVTGRSHQLRVHCQAIGHPILGDRLYAGGPALAAASRLQLHASELSFFHPTGGERLTVQSPAPF